MLVSQEGNLVTLINIFETKPDQQQVLIDQWIRFVEEVKDEPGMIGAALHRSKDGTRVVNYVQYESRDAAQAVLKHLAAGGYLKRNTELGTVAPGQYDVVYTLDRD